MPYILSHLTRRELWTGAGVLIIAFVLVFSIRSYRINHPDAITTEVDQVVYLYERTPLTDLPVLLDSLNLSYNAEHLLWTGRLFNWPQLAAGRYVIGERSSNKDFLQRMAFGMQDPVNVLVPAGTTEESFIERISGQLHFSSEELAQAIKDTSLLKELDIDEVNLFGRMLPNTYQMYWTSDPEQFLRRMLVEFDRAVSSPYEGRFREIGKTVDQIVTLASIIEWEANLVEERPTVSGLYWNRLNENWRLQADPTVNYALGERSRLVYADYRVDHPYNTYRIHGLPPGPITNPSYSSITAALYPEEHDYMFMVASPEGGHVFTRTFSEHRHESRKWTTWLREQRRIRDLREAEAMPSAE